MLTDADAQKLLERVQALEAGQLAFALELRASLLAVVAQIERQYGIGKYKALGKQEAVLHPKTKPVNGT